MEPEISVSEMSWSWYKKGKMVLISITIYIAYFDLNKQYDDAPESWTRSIVIMKTVPKLKDQGE